MSDEKSKIIQFRLIQGGNNNNESAEFDIRPLKESDSKENDHTVYDARGNLIGTHDGGEKDLDTFSRSITVLNFSGDKVFLFGQHNGNKRTDFYRLNDGKKRLLFSIEQEIGCFLARSLYAERSKYLGHLSQAEFDTVIDILAAGFTRETLDFMGLAEVVPSPQKSYIIGKAIDDECTYQSQQTIFKCLGEFDDILYKHRWQIDALLDLLTPKQRKKWDELYEARKKEEVEKKKKK